MSATPTLTGVIRIAADLGQRLTGLPTGVLVIDRHGVRVSAGAPVDDRYAQLFAVQSRSGPWLETFATGVAATCTYHEAQDRGWIPLATAMGYGGTSSVDAVPLRVSGEVLGVLSTFRAGELTASDMRAQDAARDFAEVGLTVLSLRHELSTVAEEAEAFRQHLRQRNAVAIATGMLAERLGVSTQEATATLRTMARELVRPPETVAQGVIEGTVSPTERVAAVRRRSDGEGHLG
ncbi:MAG TPA: GAF and ANTAR domain-containing protein [Kutzneria sp.]|nr:GAF and ANTAR domain-containing protein [Kutzneria sp.]